MGAERRRGALPRLETGIRLHPLPLDRLRRGAAAVPPRPRLADIPVCRRRVTLPTARPISGKRSTGAKLLYSGPLFTHQLSHLWIDFRDLRDAFMREHGSDYFQNSRQATYIHREYAIHNPAGVCRLR